MGRVDKTHAWEYYEGLKDWVAARDSDIEELELGNITSSRSDRGLFLSARFSTATSNHSPTLKARCRGTSVKGRRMRLGRNWEREGCQAGLRSSFRQTLRVLQ